MHLLFRQENILRQHIKNRAKCKNFENSCLKNPKSYLNARDSLWAIFIYIVNNYAYTAGL